MGKKKYKNTNFELINFPIKKPQPNVAAFLLKHSRLTDLATSEENKIPSNPTEPPVMHIHSIRTVEAGYVILIVV